MPLNHPCARSWFFSTESMDAALAHKYPLPVPRAPSPSRPSDVFDCMYEARIVELGAHLLALSAKDLHVST